MEPITHGGIRRITLKDIAGHLDISLATVSRALNRADDPLISEATILRVRETAAAMGYRPNRAARSLATGRTGLVGLLLCSSRVTSSFHSNVARFMDAESSSRSYQLLVNLINHKRLIGEDCKGLDVWDVDGIIAHEGPFPGLPRPAVPVVSTGVYGHTQGVDRVSVDILEGAKLAMRHLIDQGRRKIALVSPNGVNFEDQRTIAYTSQLKEAGLPQVFPDVPGSNRAEIRATFREYVQSNGVPDALFCHNDDTALAAYRALCDLGIRVPDDVAIVGCDGLEDTEYLEVPMTTIEQPLKEMCALAMNFLDQRIEDPSRPIQEAKLSATLVIRASSGGPPTYKRHNAT